MTSVRAATMSGRFRAFSFVDRITRSEPGRRIEGQYTVPASATRFPASLMAEAEFESKGLVTDAGLARLREFLSEVPAERFKTPMKAKDIPRLFTPETFCKLVITAQREAASAS